MDLNLNVGLGLNDLSDYNDLETIDTHNSQSTEDGETSTKGVESNRMSDGDGGTTISFLANEIEKKLEVGCSVVDVDQCYLLYCEYARLTGFSVRRGDQRYIGRSDEIRWKEFLCSCSGLPDRKRSSARVADYRKMVLRSNCMAKIRVRREDLTWKITIFVKSHNHPLVDIDESYLLRSSRKLSFAKQPLLQAMHSVGIPVYKACDVDQSTSVVRKDAYNHFDKKKMVTKVEDGNAMALIEYFKKKSNSDPFFFWKVEKYDDGRLMNFFFRDSCCASDYKIFGDVLSLDTAGGTNRYKLACAPFVGLNHHGANVMFGIGFLSDERTSSFNWLLETFLESMNGIAPKVIFTNQCEALMNAVDSKFPNATHRLCQCRINQNAMSHFGKLAGDVGFKEDWYRSMNEVETENEFEDLWNHMMNSYEILDREWFGTMYRLRHRWASVFSKNVFTAGPQAISRSESTNKVLSKCAKSSGSLYDFICAFEDMQTRWRVVEREEDTYCMWLPGQFVNDNKFLTHAATVYTRSIYKIFERECIQTLNVHIDSEKAVSLGEGNIEFKAKRDGSIAHERTIVFNNSSNCATCSCGKWESEGLLCCHILRLYFMKNIDAIPESYILKRWTKKAKSMVSPTESPHTISGSKKKRSRFWHSLSQS